MLPTDTIHALVDTTSNVTNNLLLASSTRTLLHASIISDPARTTNFILYCDSTLIFDTNGVNTIQIPLNYVCSENEIRYTISGNGGRGLDMILSYVNRNRLSTQDPEPYTMTPTVATSTFTAYNDISLGIVILIIMTGLLLLDFIRRLFAPRKL